MKIKKLISGILASVIAATSVGFSLPIVDNNAVNNIVAEAADYTSYTDSQGIIYHVYSDHTEVYNTNSKDIKSANIPSILQGVPVTSIGYEAFDDCSSLTSITIPDSVTSIGDWAFQDCSSLKDIYYGGSKEQWNNVNVGYNNDLNSANIHYAATTTAAGTNLTTGGKKTINVDPTKSADGAMFFFSGQKTWDGLNYAITYDGKRAGDKIIYKYNGNVANGPSVIYNKDNKTYSYDLTVSINGVDANGKVTVYIGVKGDANLDSAVDAKDAKKILVTFANAIARNNPNFRDANVTAELENFAMFLADIDNETPEVSSLDCKDATAILVSFANQIARTPKYWSEILTGSAPARNFVDDVPEGAASRGAAAAGAAVTVTPAQAVKGATFEIPVSLTGATSVIIELSAPDGIEFIGDVSNPSVTAVGSGAKLVLTSVASKNLTGQLTTVTIKLTKDLEPGTYQITGDVKHLADVSGKDLDTSNIAVGSLVVAGGATTAASVGKASAGTPAQAVKGATFEIPVTVNGVASAAIELSAPDGIEFTGDVSNSSVTTVGSGATLVLTSAAFMNITGELTTVTIKLTKDLEPGTYQITGDVKQLADVSGKDLDTSNIAVGSLVVAGGATTAASQAVKGATFEIPVTVNGVASAAIELSAPDGIEFTGDVSNSSVTTVGSGATLVLTSDASRNLTGELTTVTIKLTKDLEPGTYQITCDVKQLNDVFGKDLDKSNISVGYLDVADDYKEYTDSQGIIYHVYSDHAMVNDTTSENITSANILSTVQGVPVTKIRERAFYGCSSLTSVAIPDSVTSIGEGALKNCSSLTEINVDANNKNYSSEDGVLFNKDKTELLQYPEANKREEYKIPDSVIGIGNYTFYGCSSLTSITIPDSVTSIEDGAFENCSSLTSITIPNSVRSIGEGAFRNCSCLKIISIPESVKSIENIVFSDCSSLTSVIIPDSITRIGSCTFYGCTSLKDVYYNGSKEQWNNVNVGYNNSALNSANIHYAATTITTTTKTNDKNCSIGYAATGEAVTVTPEQAVKGATFKIPITVHGVTSVGIELIAPDGIKFTGDVSNGCVTSVGSGAKLVLTSTAFMNITGELTTVTIKLTKDLEPGTYAIKGDVKQLTDERSMDVNPSNISVGYLNVKENDYKEYTDSQGVIYNVYSDHARIIEASIKNAISLSIPSSINGVTVTSIKNSAFLGCKSLISITVPESIVSIGDFAFFDCSSLKDVYYSGTKEQWNNAHIGSYNSEFTSANIHYNGSTETKTTTTTTTTTSTTLKRTTNITTSITIETTNTTNDVNHIKSYELENGQTAQLNTNINNLRYVSNNTDVVVVSKSGKITAIGEGTAIITLITPDGETEQISIHVIPPKNKNETSSITFKPIPVKIYGISIILEQSDPNSDGNIDAKDATMVLVDYANFIANNTNSLTSSLADANGDGAIDAKDATLILVYYANKIAFKN